MNVTHKDGAITLDNASVQRLMDYGVLHFTDEGWYVGLWPQPNNPSRERMETRSARVI